MIPPSPISDLPSPPLFLWLPGYHTPSLNVTKGHHWRKYYALKQQAARELLSAIKDLPPAHLTPKILQAQQKLSLILSRKSSRKASPTTAQSMLKSSILKFVSKPKPKKARPL